MFYKIYRISDSGNKKEKLHFASKKACLDNFISIFGKDNLIIFADNCNLQTITYLKEIDVSFFETFLGSSKIFKFILNFIQHKFNNEDIVYLVEDDYWHLNDAKHILLEGLEIGDYVTLYDHPDKYGKMPDNPYIKDGGELSEVLLSKSCHWKSTNSTPLTFATKVKVIKEDLDVFIKFSLRRETKSFGIFSTLTKQNVIPMILARKNLLSIFLRLYFLFVHRKKRKLISPIPSKSTHCEIKYLAPLIDWKNINN